MALYRVQLESMMMKKLCLIGFALLLSINTFANIPKNTNAQPINGVVAIVNNQVITSQSLAHAVQFAQLSQNTNQSNSLAFKRQVLQALITQTIALQLAKMNHLSVTPTELNAVLQRVAHSNHMTLQQLKNHITQQGIPFSEYEHNITMRLLITKLEQQAVAGSIIITHDEIDNYLAQKAREPDPHTLYDVEQILITPIGKNTHHSIEQARAKAETIVQKIKNGMRFSAAAMKYSQAGDASSGGDLGWQTLSELPPSFIAPLRALKIGEMTGPFQSNSGFHMIKLVGKKTPPPTQHYVTEYHVQQIVIKQSPVKTSAQAKIATHRLRNDIVNGGKSFASIAIADSDDDNSNQQGGDLGWVQLKALPSAIAKNIPELKKNHVSEPIEDSQGNWYLIKVTGKKRVNNTLHYEENQARMAIFHQKAKQKLATWQAQIRGASYIKIVDPDLKSRQHP